MALGSASGVTVGAQTGSDGFFSLLQPIFKGIGEGIGTTSREILPRFFAQELLNQKTDQLRNPTFVSAFAPRRVDDGLVFTTDVFGRPLSREESFQKTGFLFDNLNISGGGILLLGVAIIGLVLVLRK